MKPSPLRLDWVCYPRLSYEARMQEAKPSPVPTRIKAAVMFTADGLHFADLCLESAGDSGSAYTFSVQVVATFGFDRDIALQSYRCRPVDLPHILSANVARVLYSGARELLATATGRAPHGPLMIESVLIEPHDVEISSREPMEVILREVFGVEDPEKESTSRDGKREARKKSQG